MPLVDALGESWCSDGSTTQSCNNYQLVWAKEFRYDSARARYLVADLSKPLLLAGIVQYDSTLGSAYDGDNIVSDGFAHYELGIARVMPNTSAGGANTMYYHTDHLGTTRLMTDSTGHVATGWYDPNTGPSAVTPSVYTAFGERISTTDPADGGANRYGYVGAYGYQAHDHGEIPFLHVGGRYYDPASGRFLQRDPIGVFGGLNAYEYVRSGPLGALDPSGLEIDIIGGLKAAAKKVRSVLKKISEKLTGASSPAGAARAPIAVTASALEGAPDLIRIHMACGVRARALKNGIDADDVLDRLERGRAKIKPGNGG